MSSSIKSSRLGQVRSKVSVFLGIVALCFVCGIVLSYWHKDRHFDTKLDAQASSGVVAMWSLFKQTPLTRETLSQVLKEQAELVQFPTELQIPKKEGSSETIDAILQYSFDQNLQDEMSKLVKLYSPDYAAFVAIDAESGRILSLVSYSTKTQENLALKASFPSASVFKVVTAAAAIETKRIRADSVIPFNGSNHTLYRKNVLHENLTRWTRYTTLKDAFAQSINTVFGRIGAFVVGATDLRAYAGRFGFNRRIASDIPIETGTAHIPEDRFGLAEAASGFTQSNTMSPLQGAMIGAALANDGQMMDPYVVESIHSKDGRAVYRSSPRLSIQAVDPVTAFEVRKLMRETVTKGTSRSSFRTLLRQRDYGSMDIGGKTGSLTGTEPKGKYDWFVGYVRGQDGRRIGLAALTINETNWKVKSSYLARKAVEALYPAHKKKKELKGTSGL